MTVNDLDKKLTNSLIEYSETIRTMYEEADRTSATKDDIHTLAREIFYLMDNFKHEIIDYLKQSH